MKWIFKPIQKYSGASRRPNNTHTHVRNTNITMSTGLKYNSEENALLSMLMPFL